MVKREEEGERVNDGEKKENEMESREERREKRGREGGRTGKGGLKTDSLAAHGGPHLLSRTGGIRQENFMFK